MNFRQRFLSSSQVSSWHGPGTILLPSRPVLVVVDPPVSGMTTWWDFADPASVTTDAGAISHVTDKSGSGNHLAQTTSEMRPTYGISAVLGERLAAIFDGTNDYLASTADFTTGNFTSFVVAAKRTQPAVGGNSDVLMAGRSLATYVSVTPTLDIWRGNGQSILSSNPTDWTMAAVHTRLLSGSAHSYWRNSVRLANSIAGGAGTTNVVTIGADSGGANPGNWDVGEVIGYARALTQPEIDSVIEWLQSRWST